MKNKQDILLNINSEDSNINEFLYCYKEFGSIPNRYIIHSDISYDNFLNVLSNLEELYKITEIDNNFTNIRVLSKYNDNLYFSYFILDSDSEFESFSGVTIFYKSEKDLDEIRDRLDEIIEDYDIVDSDEEKTNKNELSIVNILNGALNITKISEDFKNNDNIDLYYNADTFKSVNKLSKKINKNNKGLSILLGERGTGKTSIIKYISEKVNKNIIYIPNNTIEHTINNPEFKNLIKTYDNLVIVIDDCEVIFSDIYTRSNIITSNLLQMIDGIDSDDISVNFLLIFNSDDESEIDENLLECNNLIDIIKFDFLTKDEANDLSSFLNQKGKYKEETKLLSVLKGKNKNSQNSIGF